MRKLAFALGLIALGALWQLQPGDIDLSDVHTEPPLDRYVGVDPVVSRSRGGNGGAGTVIVTSGGGGSGTSYSYPCTGGTVTAVNGTTTHTFTTAGTIDCRLFR